MSRPTFLLFFSCIPSFHYRYHPDMPRMVDEWCVEFNANAEVENTVIRAEIMADLEEEFKLN